MAPGAKWIGCRNMDVGNGTPARYIECMQWFLAPTQIGGGNPDPTKAPDVTINSWSCPPSEGCSANTLQSAVAAQAAAGIMMVSAAQNYGPSCSTVEDPPGIYAETYSAGALNTGSDTIASFSSRGPVTIDGSGRIKPDISAPGTNTRSASNTSDNAYTIASGTSMATPHIAGAMALLWSAIPSLQNQIDPSRGALNNAAVHISTTQCGSTGSPNNVFGWGRVDILAAVTSATPTPTPTPTATPTATPTPTPTPGPITLSAAKRKVGGINTVRLTWSGATSDNIDVYRNGSLIATVPNAGTYTDSTGDTGRAQYIYHVCEAGTSTCSNDVTVRFSH
jgi:subtilisin family serine protease